MRFVFPALLLLAATALPAAAQEEDTLDWLKSYPQAIEEAKRTNRPIFLEFRCEA